LNASDNFRKAKRLAYSFKPQPHQQQQMKIKELLSTPDKWTKGLAARNKKGEPVFTSDKDAYSFCLLGACAKCYPDLLNCVEVEKKIRDILRNENGFLSIVDFNDSSSTTFEDIRRILEIANV
jgi:hypothetical protein